MSSDENSIRLFEIKVIRSKLILFWRLLGLIKLLIVKSFNKSLILKYKIIIIVIINRIKKWDKRN